MTISNKERFLGVLGYAPTTIGAPAFIHAADIRIFKKEKEEKKLLKLVKASHKKELQKAYPDGIGKHLNIPGKELKNSIKLSESEKTIQEDKMDS